MSLFRKNISMKKCFKQSDVFTVMTLSFLFWLAPIAFAQPACDAPVRRIVGHPFFRICYDTSLKAPVWTEYELRPGHLAGAPAPRRPDFRLDPSAAFPTASNADFRNSGYSRGHLVPAADFAGSVEARQATFFLTNVVPQHQSVNAGRWRMLENAVRRIAARADSVVVFSGPLFESEQTEFLAPGGVAVPTHTYKVLLAVHAGRRTMFAAIIPNGKNPPQPLNFFAVTVDEVERRSGFDFFDFLEDAEEAALESRLDRLP
jgi:endonuclease G